MNNIYSHCKTLKFKDKPSGICCLNSKVKLPVLNALSKRFFTLVSSFTLEILFNLYEKIQHMISNYFIYMKSIVIDYRYYHINKNFLGEMGTKCSYCKALIQKEESVG